MPRNVVVRCDSIVQSTNPDGSVTLSPVVHPDSLRGSGACTLCWDTINETKWCEKSTENPCNTTCVLKSAP